MSEKATMIDECPLCGGGLRALIEVVAYYDIENCQRPDPDPEGGIKYTPDQSWTFDDVPDKGEPASPPFEIQCVECNAYWPEGQFTLNDEGTLGELGEAEVVK